MERLSCLIMGYVFGLFQTGYIFSKLHHMDIREHGSGNSGATNVLRVMGWKAGLVVLLGDAFKMIIACLITRFYFADRPDVMYLFLLYTAFGVILGHNYPFYMGFKGGKGIAATAGLLLSTDIRIALICLVVFAAIVYATRYVSLGSIVIVSIFAAGMIFFGERGDYGLAQGNLTEFYVIAVLIAVMGIYRHKANIQRLLNGTENKVGSKKKE